MKKLVLGIICMLSLGLGLVGCSHSSSGGGEDDGSGPFQGTWDIEYKYGYSNCDPDVWDLSGWLEIIQNGSNLTAHSGSHYGDSTTSYSGTANGNHCTLTPTSGDGYTFNLRVDGSDMTGDAELRYGQGCWDRWSIIGTRR